MKFPLGVSADGRYLGTEIPWPNTKIVDMVSGTKYDRHVADPFGCQPNMAPDNSYRFFYLRSDHDVIRMWAPALGTDNWDVRIDKMPGNIDFNSAGYDHDCVLPRWTNQPLFFTNSYPLVIWNYSDGRIFDSSPAALKGDQQKDSCGTGVFCLGKFTADYRAVEKYVRVTTCDVRKRDVVGDGWISGTPVSIEPSLGQNVPAGKSIMQLTAIGSLILINTQSDVQAVVRLTDASGRLVRQWAGANTLTIDTRTLSAGVYRLSVASGRNHLTRSITIMQ